MLALTKQRPPASTRAAAAARRLPATPRRCPVAVRVAEATSTVVTAPAPAITLTPEALEQLKKLRAEHKKDNLLLRVGVKQGGCSGLSYVMDFEDNSKVSPDDHRMSYEDFELVVDPKSLLYLFGMHLGYSTALIGGGFQFQNPNASESCGCGKSFGV